MSRQLARYRRLRALNICTQCGKISDGRARCPECRAIHCITSSNAYSKKQLRRSLKLK